MVLCGRLFKLAPQTGHRPAQSGRQSSIPGSMSASESCDQAATSSTPPTDVWGFEFIAPAGLRNLEHVNLEHRGRGFQTPHAGTLERGAEAQSQRVALSDGPGNVNPNRNRRRSDRIVLASELERVDWDGQVEPPALAGARARRPARSKL